MVRHRTPPEQEPERPWNGSRSEVPARTRNVSAAHVSAGHGPAGHGSELHLVTEPTRPPRRRRRRTWWLVALLVVVLGLTAGWFWWPSPPEVWKDGSAHGEWIAVFDGEGSTTSDGSTIVLSPRPATSADETHAGLVVSVTQYGDVDLSATMHTVEQTRTGSTPNPWEVGWLVWHYDDHRRFYYFALKSNGWELGKVDPAYPGGQRFLATGGSPVDAGTPQTVRVRQVGTTMDVWVDESAVVTFTDAEEPYTQGSVGMYSEDARVEFSDVTARPASLP